MSLIHSNQRNNIVIIFCIFLGALLISFLGAQKYAGSWNDGSRMAAVESLVDYHTFSIDQSMYVHIPSDFTPYRPLRSDFSKGTQDKLYIKGHFYSDKSPVPLILMAGFYKLLQFTTGLKARVDPQDFYFWMNFVFSGFSYSIAVLCLYLISRQFKLPLVTRMIVTCSFAFTTVALPYARSINNHIFLLGVAALIFLNLTYLTEEIRSNKLLSYRLWLIGTLTGLGFSIDLGAGPILFLCLLILIIYRCRNLHSVILFSLGALPWLICHYAINYYIGGTFKPLAAVSQYLIYPGSAFNLTNMTGVWHHQNIWKAIVYAFALLFGPKGFFINNLPLFLLLPGIVLFFRKLPKSYLPEVLCGLAWCVGTWLIYGLSSNNYAGQCCTIRWFVPLLVPIYYFFAILLREYPNLKWDLLILSFWSSFLVGLMWWCGPWKGYIYYFAPFHAVAMISWILYRGILLLRK